MAVVGDGPPSEWSFARGTAPDREFRRHLAGGTWPRPFPVHPGARAPDPGRRPDPPQDGVSGAAGLVSRRTGRDDVARGEDRRRRTCGARAGRPSSRHARGARRCGQDATRDACGGRCLGQPQRASVRRRARSGARRGVDRCGDRDGARRAAAPASQRRGDARRIPSGPRRPARARQLRASPHDRCEADQPAADLVPRPDGADDQPGGAGARCGARVAGRAARRARARDRSRVARQQPSGSAVRRARSAIEQQLRSRSGQHRRGRRDRAPSRWSTARDRTRRCALESGESGGARATVAATLRPARPRTAHADRPAFDSARVGGVVLQLADAGGEAAVRARRCLPRLVRPGIGGVDLQ